jgi:hypothetical protein
MKPKKPSQVTAIAAFLCAWAASAHDQMAKLGQVHFPVSCSREAQTQLDRAVALLHSFWHTDAAAA